MPASKRRRACRTWYDASNPVHCDAVTCRLKEFELCKPCQTNMEGVEMEKSSGWDRLWSAQSERVAEMQRRLQSACRDAASLDADASDDPSLSQKAATGEPHPETHSKLQACQAMPADEGAGSYPPEKAICGDSVEVPQAVAHHEEITTVSNEATQLLQKKAQTRIPTIRIRGPSLAIAQEPT
eukprot:symbB.v1.2.024094.t1/scaffold2255.1/size84268/7